MPYITDAVLSAASATSGQAASAADLPAHWAAAVTRGNRMAYRRIRAVLLDRGFIDSQINAWDARVEWSETVGINRVHWYATDDLEVRRLLNEELKELLEQLAEEAIEIDGEVAFPDAANGRIGYGEYDEDEDDRHTIEDTL